MSHLTSGRPGAVLDFPLKCLEPVKIIQYPAGTICRFHMAFSRQKSVTFLLTL
jgi:hypothetical protein